MKMNSSSVVSIVVLVLVLLLNLSCVSSSRASVVDTSMYRPDWCRGDGSRATKTTGECICLNRHCTGPRCRREQEFVYYVYSECKTCECATRDVNASSSSSSSSSSSASSSSSSDGNDNDYVKTPLSKKTSIKKRFAAVSNYNNNDNNNNNGNNNNMNDNKNDDDNDAFSLIEFIEENSRVVFAITCTSLLFGMVISAMYGTKQQKKATDDDGDDGNGKQTAAGSEKND